MHYTCGATKNWKTLNTVEFVIIIDKLVRITIRESNKLNILYAMT